MKETYKCYFCDNEAIFKNITNGYHKICNSKECLGKTRATGTYEFLMYKYNLPKDDAIKLMNGRADDRGEKIKEGLNKSFEKNENFFKEKSRQCVEFWLKKGYSQENAEIEVKKSFDDIHTKTWKKRRENSELYQDVNTTQIGYWLKKGYTEKESKERIKERQLTFTLEKCIQKYGEIDGLKIWTERQKNWSEKVEIMYKNGLFVKFKKEPYSNNEIELFSKVSERISKKTYFGENQFYRYFRDLGQTFAYDFVLEKKVIEFNGDYWHCNPKLYKENFFNKSKQMFAKDIWNYDKIKMNSIENLGYESLIIWENDYKQNEEQVIQRCIDFINK
jgi:G:T-mismatch repair DNA endonuclease (very short patch repair protein)